MTINNAVVITDLKVNSITCFAGVFPLHCEKTCQHLQQQLFHQKWASGWASGPCGGGALSVSLYPLSATPRDGASQFLQGDVSGPCIAGQCLHALPGRALLTHGLSSAVLPQRERLHGQFLCPKSASGGTLNADHLRPQGHGAASVMQRLNAPKKIPSG